MRSGGEILVDELIGYGVNTAFCVPGESYLGALDAMYSRQEQLKLIACRQEGGASYMAEAWGKITGQPGICFVSRGPGASNAMIGIHTAFQDSTPLICFIGQISRVDRGREAFQELNYEAVYSNVAKKVFVIDDAARIPEQLNAIWQHAMTGRPGPVMVVLYEDMLKDKVDIADIPKLDAPLRGHYPAAPSPLAIKRVNELIQGAKKPLIVCGSSSWDYHSAELLTALSEKLQIPVASVFRRQDSFDNTHGHYAGELGLVAPQALLQYVREADVLLAIGPRLGDITTQGYQLLKPPLGIDHQKLIHVHPAAEEINGVYHADLSIVSDSNLFLEALSAHPEMQSKIDRSAMIAELHQSYLDFMSAEQGSGDRVDMNQISRYLRETLPATTVITNGAGNYTTWGQRHYQFRLCKTQLGPTNGSMGYGVPAGVAAKLARPDATVVSFSGDGCFLMNGQELATAVQYDLAIIFLVINNGSYGTIRMHQERHYPDRPIGTDLNNPDFAALGRAYGAEGSEVEKTEDFQPAFEAALASDRPTVIDIRTH